jgi:DNA-binding HxlR family transcriptional regulator
MTRRARHTPQSSLETSLELLGAKWTVPLLRELEEGARRFGELSSALPRVSPRTLTLRLAALEKAKVISRTAFKEVPPRVEYALTDHGRELGAILRTLETWSDSAR